MYLPFLFGSAKMRQTLLFYNLIDGDAKDFSKATKLYVSNKSLATLNPLYSIFIYVYTYNL